MKANVYSQLGGESSVELKDSVWGFEGGVDSVAQAVTVQRSNARLGSAHAKTRGDVSGGGRKPWKQKGTGRARHGSTRSPIWVKGGVTFVPNGRNWSKRINKKMNKQSVCALLSARLEAELLKFVEIDAKSEMKDMRKFINELVDGRSSALVVSADQKVLKSVRNVGNVRAVSPEEVNVSMLLLSNQVVIDTAAAKILDERLSK